MVRTCAIAVCLPIAGCRAPVAQIGNTVPATPSPIGSGCPDQIVYEGWTAELFPGCPTQPFLTRSTALLVCAPECATPCRATIDTEHEHVQLAFRYDDHRRWLATYRDGQLLRACSYGGSALAECREGDTRFTLTRDREGRLVEARAQDQDFPHAYYRWSGGDVVEVLDRDLMRDRQLTVMTLAYRDHRLVGQHGRAPPDDTFTYQHGRLVTRDERYPMPELVRTRLDYDARGRLVVVDSRHTSAYDNFVPYRISYSYDAHDRLVKAVRIDGEDDVETTAYEYDCGPM